MIHRDLKPGNVMLTPHGVKLLDFGLAKLRDGDYRERAQEPTDSVPLTRGGDLLGTLPYMAPEQIEGQEIDPRTDIFSFGVMLYEMMTGRRPFGGNTRSALIAAIVGAQPVSASSVRPSISPPLERVIERCLAKDKQGRWQTARDLATNSNGLPRSARPSRAVAIRSRTTLADRSAIGLVAATSDGGSRVARRDAPRSRPDVCSSVHESDVPTRRGVVGAVHA